MAVLFVSKFNLFFGAFNFSSVSWKDFLIINKYIYLFFCLSLAIALCVVLTFSDSWMGIRRAIDVMVSGSALLNKFYYIVKEEVLYRFLLYYSLNRLFGRGTAFFCTVTLFSLMHHTNSFYYPFAVAPAGLALSIVSIATGSILAPIFLHMIFNASIYIFIVLFL